MDTGSAILNADAFKDTRSSSSESADGPDIHSRMCVPLINKAGRALGVIQLENNSLQPQINQDDLDVLVSLGSQAVLAIEG